MAPVLDEAPASRRRRTTPGPHFGELTGFVESPSCHLALAREPGSHLLLRLARAGGGGAARLPAAALHGCLGRGRRLVFWREEKFWGFESARC